MNSRPTIGPRSTMCRDQSDSAATRARKSLSTEVNQVRPLPPSPKPYPASGARDMKLTKSIVSYSALPKIPSDENCDSTAFASLNLLSIADSASGKTIGYSTATTASSVRGNNSARMRTVDTRVSTPRIRAHEITIPQYTNAARDPLRARQAAVAAVASHSRAFGKRRVFDGVSHMASSNAKLLETSCVIPTVEVNVPLGRISPPVYANDWH